MKTTSIQTGGNPPEILELTVVGQDNVLGLFSPPDIEYTDDELFGKTIKSLELSGASCDENGLEIVSYRIYKNTTKILKSQSIEHRKLCKKFLAEKDNYIKQLEKQLKQAIEMIKQTQGLIETIAWFEKHYGKGIDPFVVLQQLYKTGKVPSSADSDGWIKAKRELTPPRKWTLYNTDDKKFRDGVNYWLSIFKSLKILDSDGNIRYAIVTYHEANHILENYFKNKNGEEQMENVGEFIDLTTNGGENLTEEEKEEITKEYEKVLDK